MGRVLRWRTQRVSELFPVGLDPRDIPIYTVAEVAFYLRVPRSTLRHWIKPPRNGRALIETTSKRLSFYNLLEAHVLKVVLRRKAWLRRVRPAVERLRERAPTSEHPLLSRELRTAGGYRDIFIVSLTGEIENASKGTGQLELRALLKAHLRQIDFDAAGTPYRLRPLNFQHIGLDHRVLGGRPAVLGTRVPVAVLASRRRAGESLESLARDYDLDRNAIREAVRYGKAA